MLSVDGREVQVTHSGKLYFSRQMKVSKLDLVSYPSANFSKRIEAALRRAAKEEARSQRSAWFERLRMRLPTLTSRGTIWPSSGPRRSRFVTDVQPVE